LNKAEFKIDNNSLLSKEKTPIKPRRLKYKLKDLMEQCNLNAPFSEEELAWLNAPRIGLEL
jgi:antitoxin ChpS